MRLTMFTVAVILILAFCVLMALRSSKYYAKEVPIAAYIITPALAVALLIGSFFIIVPTQQIGIPVTFGKPEPALGNGRHWKAPWTKVEKMDGSIQFTENIGRNRSDIRLGNQSNAYVQNVIGWRIKMSAADTLYRDHKKFENVGSKLVNPAIANALNEAFKNYDPLQRATGKAPALSEVAKEVKSSLVDQIGDKVEIVSVTIPKVDFDDQTQKRIDQYQMELANTRIAEQRRKTAAEEAAVNKTLSESVSKDPNVLVSKCLDIISEMVEKKQSVPVGFSCWPNGSQQPVLTVPATEKKG